ncbi:MAG: hypothetical protein R6W85_13710, partial [Gillisia sp.]
LILERSLTAKDTKFPQSAQSLAIRSALQSSSSHFLISSSIIIHGSFSIIIFFFVASGFFLGVLSG